MTKLEALAARTVKGNPRKRAACSRGGYSQKEYGTVFNAVGGVNGTVVRALYAGARKYEDEQMKRRPL